MTRRGHGPRARLLPSLSSISTRTEMAPLQARLSETHEPFCPDWAGFCPDDKPRIDWRPEAMADWLAHLLREIAPDPALVVAAGHAAGYVLRHFAERPETTPQLLLVAPTRWEPFPTMLGRRPDWLSRVVAAMDNPATGPALYAMNLNDLVMRRMARGHVYSDPNWLHGERRAQKRAVSNAGGARFASVRFVTGALGPFRNAEDARAAARIPKDRVQMVWGAETPRKSQEEMHALSEAAGIDPIVLPRGKLGLHEEFPGEVAPIAMRRNTPPAEAVCP